MDKNVFIFDEKFIKDYDEDIDEGYVLEVDTKFPKTLHAFYNDLPFLPKRMKIEKFDKLVCNLYELYKDYIR